MEGTGVDVVDVVETVSFWDSRFFVVAGSLFFSFFLMPMDSKQIHTCLKQSKLNLFYIYNKVVSVTDLGSNRF
jgi:hypothetical protein